MKLSTIYSGTCGILRNIQYNTLALAMQIIRIFHTLSCRLSRYYYYYYFFCGHTVRDVNVYLLFIRLCYVRFVLFVSNLLFGRCSPFDDFSTSHTMTRRLYRKTRHITAITLHTDDLEYLEFARVVAL